MSGFRLFVAVGLALAITAASTPQAFADEDIIITGCVVNTPSEGLAVSQPTMLVWSDGNVMLVDASVRFPGDRAVGTSGPGLAPVLYWLDDADDVARHAGHRVEVIGEIEREFDKGEVEFEEKDGFVEIEVEFDGNESKARIPRWMLGRQDVDDLELDILVRKVEVEKVNVLSAPCR